MVRVAGPRMAAGMVAGRASRWHRLLVLLVACGLGAASPTRAATEGAGAPAKRAAEVLWRSEVTLPGGPDLGQHLGTLLEVRAGDGELLMAAGFASGGQTGGINNNRSLNVAVSATPSRAGAAGGPSSGQQALPQAFPERPFGATQLFLLTVYQGELLARLRGASGPIKRLDPLTGRWQTLKSVLSREAEADGPVLAIQVIQDKLLGVLPTKLIYDDVLLDLRDIDPEGELSFEVGRFTNGRLYLGAIRRSRLSAREPLLLICDWRPGQQAIRHCESLPLRDVADRPDAGARNPPVGLHPLADGQTLAYGLDGYLYAVRRQALRPLVQIRRSRSWQIYSSIERYDSVLMGQYPSGNLVSLNLAKHLSDWRNPDEWPDELLPELLIDPPVAAESGVRRDEAQSLMAFGDTLLVGMWPWGELFAGRPGQPWQRVVPSLTGLQPTEDGRHPYEAEVGTNCLGMRIFQVLPWRGGAVFQTTVKNEDPECRPTLAGADPVKMAPYGQVYYLDMPGSLSCTWRWPVSKPTRLAFSITSDNRLEVHQDGELLCARGVDAAALVAALKRPGVKRWTMPAVGLYGRRSQSYSQPLR